MGVVRIVFVFMLTFFQLITPWINIAKHGGIDSYFEKWSAEDEYTSEYAATIEKDPDKDFVVLNIADVQLSADEVYGTEGEIAEATIKKCIEDLNPDLITLSGDNSWCKMGYIRIVDYIDSFGIPWAAVMGNHDGDNGDETQEAFCAYLLEKAENSLFKFGPEDMGYGNYVINITENGEIIHSIYMMDTHSDTSLSCGGYDHLWDNQIAWYKWCVEGNNALAGKTVESSIIFHIPNIEYREAWADAQYNEETGEFENPAYADGFGNTAEPICSPEYDSGFFDVVKALGSTKNIIAGHDHVNNFSLEYEGVRLSYSLKCGPGCYWDSAKNGGSTLTIGSDGHATFAHYYVNPDDLGVNTGC